MEEVKSHPWFKDVDWDALKDQKLKPPYDPKVTDSNWMKNFEEEFLSQDSRPILTAVRDSAMYEMEKENQKIIDDAFADFDDYSPKK